MELVLGMPWVFQRLRYWSLGGFDFAPGYRLLNVGAADIVLDVGCGMGDAMNHLAAFQSYHGFDLDQRAIAAFHERVHQPNIHLYAQRCDHTTIAALNPTKVVLCGLLHHIPDSEALGLLQTLRQSAHCQRIMSIDTVFLPGRRVNNLLARCDRGRHVRTVEQYQALAQTAGFHVQNSFWIETRRRVASYYDMILEPP